MKRTVMAAVLILATGASAQDMPGMDMPAKPKTSAPKQNSSTPRTTRATKTDQQDHTSSPGMNMDTDQSVMPSQASSSVIHDTYNLQEPEDPSHKTGSNLPVPDLLNEVVRRPAMPLSVFLQIADKKNPTLAQAEALVQRSAAQARQAGLYPNPTAGYQGEQIRGGAYGGGEQGAFVQQTIVLGGKLGLRRNIYNQQKQSDQIGVEEQTYRVHSDVTRAFYTALAAQAVVDVRQKLVGLALDAVETAHQLANVGQADAPDILQSEVEAEQVKVEFQTAQRDFLQSFRVLAAYTGDPSLPVSPLAGELERPPDLDANQQVARIVDSSPTVKRLQKEVVVGEARLHDAKREPVPDLQVKAGEEYNLEHLVDRPVVPVGPQSFVTVGMTLPVWNRNQGNVSAAEADIERAKKDVLREQLSLRQMAESLAQSYLSSRFTAERYKTQLIPRAQRAYQLYLKKYEAMAQAYPQVLVSQRTLFQLQIGYLSALQSTWMDAIALENFTLSGGLTAPESRGSSSTSINLPNSSGSSIE